jgi:4-hydroxy-tetrahydrodipicolinate synthase
MNLKPEFVAKMAREIPNIKYIKDSSGDLAQVEELMFTYNDLITSFNGQDTVTFSGLSLGAKGSVWGAANCMPRQCAQLFDLCDAGRLNEARELWEKMYPVQQFLVTEGYVASVKAGANMIGFRVGDPRPPFRPLSPQKQQELRQLLDVAGAIPVGAAR